MNRIEHTLPNTSTNSTAALYEACDNGVFYLTRVPSGGLHANYIALILANTVLSIVGSAANLLVILAYFKTLRRHEFNTTLLTYLAIVDLLTSAIVQPLMISRHVLELMDERSCVYWLVIRRLFEFTVPVSFLTVGLITYERYQALFSPVKYRSPKLKRRIKRAMVAVWLFTFVTSCLRVFDFFSIIYFGLALLIMVALFVANTTIYLKIGKMAANYTKQRRVTLMAAEVNGVTRKTFAKDRRSTRTMLYIFLSLFLCYLPMVGSILYALITGKESENLAFLFGYLPWAETFAFLNSTLDPFIYCLRNPRLKDAVIGLVCRKQQKGDSGGNRVDNNVPMLNSSSVARSKNTIE